jgi:hypothetical protein
MLGNYQVAFQLVASCVAINSTELVSCLIRFPVSRSVGQSVSQSVSQSVRSHK